MQSQHPHVCDASTYLGTKRNLHRVGEFLHADEHALACLHTKPHIL